jgi:hypothetical protein
MWGLCGRTANAFAVSWNAFAVSWNAFAFNLY